MTFRFGHFHHLQICPQLAPRFQQCLRRSTQPNRAKPRTPVADGKSQFQADIEPNFVFCMSQNLMKVCGSVHPPIWQSANRNKGSKCFCISLNINNLDNNCKNVEIFIKIRFMEILSESLVIDGLTGFDFSRFHTQ